jgi:hypothetical protein
MIVAAAASALILAACSEEDFEYDPTPDPTPIAFDQSMSEATGKVGLMTFRRNATIPRAAGMGGEIRGYVVSHPALPGPLTVRRNGREIPVLAFLLSMELTNSAGVAGLESMRGRGKMQIFYHPDGATTALAETHRGKPIETDDVLFEAELNLNTASYMIRLREDSVSSSEFNFRGKTSKTPIGRHGWDLMYGEFDGELQGLALASSSATTAFRSPSALLASISSFPSY